MRFRGKQVLVSYQDTFNLDKTLDPIIAAGLKKFLEVVKASGIGGFPNTMIEEMELGNTKLSPEQEQACLDLWHSNIEKMIYAFEDIEPDICQYDFEFGPIEENLPIRNQAEYDRYSSDLDKHQQKVEEGRMLFAKHYSSLWW